MFLIILWSSLTSQNKKVTLGDTTAWGRVIALFFSFLWVFRQKISSFLEQMNPNLVITL